MEAILYGDGDRVVSGVEAAEEDLHADDVVGGDGEEPASGAAECRVGAVDGGAECGGGEAGTLGVPVVPEVAMMRALPGEGCPTKCLCRRSASERLGGRARSGGVVPWRQSRSTG